MKKCLVALLFLSVLVFSACAVDATDPQGAGDRAAAADAVRLLRATSFDHIAYGNCQSERGFEIRVQNIAYIKSVWVHYKKADGTWADLAASYVGAADSGYEIWSAGKTVLGSVQSMTEFVIGYKVNGITYWDNNGGANYKLASGDGVLLGQGRHVRSWVNFAYNTTGFGGAIDIRNLAYTKNVQVVYTLNNWATSATVSARFNSSYTIGYASCTSPNKSGIEYWSFSTTVANNSTLQYYVRYTVNGVTYYDNNFGRNYTLKKSGP